VLRGRRRRRGSGSKQVSEKTELAVEPPCSAGACACRVRGRLCGRVGVWAGGMRERVRGERAVVEDFAFGLPRPEPARLRESATHSNSPSATLLESVKVSGRQSVGVSKCRGVKESGRHSVKVSKCRGVTVSGCHSVKVLTIALER
jgi:hypothetical protein